MIRLVVSCLVALCATGAWASDLAAKRPSVDSTPTITNDAEDLLLDGGVLDLVATRDTDKFRRDIVRAGALVQYESIYDFIAIGASRNHFQQENRSITVDSLVGAIRKVDRATAEGVSARVALAFAGDQIKVHGDGTWNIRLSNSTSVELIANRDAVETIVALERAILANFVAVSLDHALTDRLTVIGMPTYRRFSDGNEQTGVRGWLIYGLLPEHGLSLQLKARGYESSQNGGGAYFSPERYERAEIGLRLRRAFGDWRVFATADVGRERIDREIEKPTVQAALTVQRSFANNAGLGLQFAYYRASDSANNTGESGRYAWRMARLVLTIPF